MFCYALGWTQDTSGVQMIRAAAILQLLLGNMGRPGGGIMAMRGHASIQGSTDIPTLFDLLPGYLPMPKGREEELTVADYVASNGAERGWWSNFDKYIVSLLKAYFGDAATRGERLRLLPAAEDHRQPLALPDDAARVRRRPRRAVRDGPEPRRRLSALRVAAARAGPPEVAGGARPQRARDRDVLARRAGGALGRVPHGGHPDRGLPDAGRRRTSRRTATSPTRSGCCSGTTRRSSRPATRARSCGSCITCSSACRRTTRAPATIATGRS